MKEIQGEKGYKRQYLHSFYQGNTARYILAMVFTVLCFPTNLVGSWLLGQVMDAIAVKSLGRLGEILVIYIIFLVVSFAVNMLMYWFKSSFVCNAMTRYKALAFEHISEKGIRAFSKEHAGSYISLLTNDATSIEENYLKKSFILVYYILLFFGTLGMMLWYSPLLTVATILLSLFPAAVSVVMGKQMAVREKYVSDKGEGFVNQLKDLLGGFSVIKSFQAEKETQKIFNASNQALEEGKRRRYWWECLISAVSENFCATVMQMGIFLLGAFLAIRGDITAGTVLIFVNLCNFIIMPINIVPQYWASRKAAKGLIEKLAEMTVDNVENMGDPIAPVLKDAICLENVTFGYEAECPVLKNVCLRLESGKRYALVGGSGSGKSTLLQLLMGAYDGYFGNITVDGKELREIRTNSLYNLISMIDQNVFLFDDTIRQNITMYREFSKEAIDRAIRQAGLQRVIAERGEDYHCGENGNGLSGGERQRVSIARCMLRGTPVLLLDEATAALDNKTAYEITQEILNLEGLTRLVVTHRLEESLLKQYDEIIVLRNGNVCERGGYEELIEGKGYFYSLYHVTNG